MSGVLHAASAGVANTDQHWNNTSILLRMNGANGSTTFTDSSRNNYAIDRFGTTALSATQSKTGGTSVFFDGTNDYLLIQSASTATIPTTGPYTIEFWMYPTALKNCHIIGWGTWSTTKQTQTIRLTSTGNITDTWFGSGLGATGAATLNAWQHIAATYDGTTQRIFKDGVLLASGANSDHNVTKVDNVTIGWLSTSPTNERFQGYLDDIRVTKDVARYVTDFTPRPVL